MTARHARLHLLLAACALAGCGNKNDASASASASAKGLAPTCAEVGSEYGAFYADDLIKSAPPNVKVEEQAFKKGVQAAYIESCEKDQWGSITLDCLSAVFKKGDPKKRLQQTEVCIEAIGKDKLDRLNKATVDAMTKASAPK
ncbi:MAG: hypothetical protein HOW73_12125 [Polyangiaceae bacterium]|nr:hypothetical protein [Polyangiaceae bacterium]